MLSANLVDPKPWSITEGQRIRENEGLCKQIKGAKDRITPNQKRWDVAKKFTNEFEYIFSFNNEGVADIVPISRSFFKIVEIFHEASIAPALPPRIKIACLCEGPGGFVQGLRYACSTRGITVDHAYAITLVSTDKKVPNWKLANDTATTLVVGSNGRGDIYEVSTIDDFVKTAGEGAVDVVTADGGFDFSADFNSQEQHFVRLMTSEIYAGVRVQRAGGHFVMKVFDLFNADTVRLIALLCELYASVRVHKPNTSRPANSERYVVCSDFVGVSKEILEVLRGCVVHFEDTKPIERVLRGDRFKNTLLHVHDLNRVYVKKQVMYIERTLDLIKESRVFDKRRYDALCVDWCVKYGVPIKPSFKNAI